MWYDKAYDELEQLLADGEISQEEFRIELGYLREELEEARSLAAQQTYDNY